MRLPCPTLTTTPFSSTLPLPTSMLKEYCMSAPVTLRRVLKFRTVVSTSTGLAYAAISFLGCVQLASLVGGDSGWIAIVIAGLLAVLAALCYSELNALYPTAAGVRLYLQESLNENFSLIITFGYMLTI